MQINKGQRSLRMTLIALSALALTFFMMISFQTPDSVVAASSFNALTNDTNLVCMNKTTGTLRVTFTGACRTSSEQPFVFPTIEQTSANGFKPQLVCGSTGKEVCEVGSAGPGEGIVFFVDRYNRYPTFTYLEAAPANWSGKDQKTDPTTSWCDDTTHIIQLSNTSWNSRIVGSGRANTRILNLSCVQGAGTLVQNYNLGNSNKFSDWFIPSLGELILLSTNLQGTAGLISGDYWSSSEFSDVGGWAQSVGHGYQGNANKATLFHVRPIRSF